MKTSSRPPGYDRRDNLTILDHFECFVDGHLWTALADDIGVTAPSVGDAIGGRLSMATGATDNNETGIGTTEELFLLGAGEPLWGAARIQFSEANTDDANVAFGFGSAFGANILQDDGAGPRASGNLILIYKLDGETAWRVHSRDNANTFTNLSLTTAGGTDFQELEIEASEFSSTEAVVTFKVDGLYLRDTNTNDVITHRMAYASLTEMDLFLYVKAGGANSETLVCDWIAASHRLY